jgi:AcrR family transcriptional regulator
MPRRANVRPDEAGYDKVLVAGRELFGERGYHATSIAEIGERADISKSVLYHYFGSKAGLYTAILEAETAELLHRVAAAVPSAATRPRLRPGIDAYLTFLAERPATWRLLVRDPPPDAELAAVHARLEAARSAALTELLATPQKRAASPAHVELVATAIRTFATWWYDHPDVPRDHVTDSIIDVARAGARRL